MKRLMLALSLSVLPWSATAQTVVSVSTSPADPRIDAARPVIEKLWPLGTYRRMMDGPMDKMMDQLLETVLGMKMSDIEILEPGTKPEGAAKDTGDKSMAQIMAESDPHFRERMKLTFDTMIAEVIPLFTKAEPAIRDSLTKIYARNFSATELADMDRFFATPSGKAYADKAMIIFMEPEMIQAMQSFAPEMLQAMPEIMRKVEKATAHLPPPPKKTSEE